MASPGLASKSKDSEAQQGARPPQGQGWPFGGPPETMRRAGHPLALRAMAQAQMALGTLAETKVPRLPGRDPASIFAGRRLRPQRHPGKPYAVKESTAPGPTHYFFKFSDLSW